jgi:hypothetical protein
MRLVKIISAFCATGLAVSIAWAAYQVTSAPPARPLAPYFPAGALMYLEAKDFGAVVTQWNTSQEKRAWLASDNYAEFSRSRLFGRLGDAQNEFATAAGVPPDMPFLQQVAGRESALAVYDIGKLQFLYVTRLPQATLNSSSLWQVRGKYETRSAAGVTYYVHTTASNGRTVAFGATNDYLVLATREDLIAGALALIAGQQQRKLVDESWYDRSIKAAHQPGDLRMALNLERIIPSPYFRSYWVQRNVSELKQYTACVSDLYLSRPEYREERVLLRSESLAPSAQSPGQHSTLAGVIRLVPEQTGLYRAWADPDVSLVWSQVQELLSPSIGPSPAARDYAPGSPAEPGVSGSEADLERRIDEAPLIASGARSDALRDLLSGAKLTAVLQLASSRAMSDGVFVAHSRALVLVSSGDWDAAAVRHALSQQLAAGLTTSQLGVTWLPDAGGKVFHLDGLQSLLVAASGPYLIVGDDPAAVSAVLARLNAPASKVQATYAAGFFHSREQSPFVQATSVIDRSRQGSSAPGAVGSDKKPQFFSGNVAGLSHTLVNVESEALLSNDTGEQVTQTIRYRWSK